MNEFCDVELEKVPNAGNQAQDLSLLKMMMRMRMLMTLQTMAMIRTNYILFLLRLLNCPVGLPKIA